MPTERPGRRRLGRPLPPPQRSGSRAQEMAGLVGLATSMAAMTTMAVVAAEAVEGGWRERPGRPRGCKPRHCCWWVAAVAAAAGLAEVVVAALAAAMVAVAAAGLGGQEAEAPPQQAQATVGAVPMLKFQDTVNLRASSLLAPPSLTPFSPPPSSSLPLPCGFSRPEGVPAD